MKKRIAALLLCCAMLLTLSPSLIATAAAEDELIPANGAAAESSVDEVQPETNDQIGGELPAQLRSASFGSDTGERAMKRGGFKPEQIKMQRKEEL